MNKQQLILKLNALNILQFGTFKLRSGLISPFYINFRHIVSYPEILKELSEHLWGVIKDMDFDQLCGVPYAALSLSASISVLHNKPMLVKRKEQKKYGTKKILEGIFEQGQNCLVIDDIITSGISMVETCDVLEKEGLVVTDLVTLVDRMQGGKKYLEEKGYKVTSLFSIKEIVAVLLEHNKISAEIYAETLSFIANNSITAAAVKQSETPTLFTYEEREAAMVHPVGKRLLEIMRIKNSNLCCSADVKSKKDLLELAESVGPSVCMLKTHIDNIPDFDKDLVVKLKALSKKYNFLLFEDRKFADIGHIAMQQFTNEWLDIAYWADVVTVHAIAGSSSIEALKATGKLDSTALILIAEMSTKDTLTDQSYAEKAIAIAEQNKDVVLGVVAQRYRSLDPAMMLFTPGINLEVVNDAHGQTYNTPDFAFKERGVDVMIVGRGIYLSDTQATEAIKYRKMGWNAYLSSN